MVVDEWKDAQGNEKGLLLHAAATLRILIKDAQPDGL
jgi:hypothetical protein